MGKYSGDFVPLNIHRLDHCSEKFNFRVLTLKEIYKTIDSLENSKSPGPGFVHVWALKAAKYAIGTHLKFIFHECIQNSVFPTALKHAYVTPIHKKGSTTQVCNYRPSFLRSFSFSKWWITLIKTIYWIQSNLDSKTKNLQQMQYCIFTETVVENHENGQNTAAIFLDLAKAFNWISHKIFLKKAECFNFSEPAVNLLRYFLEERSQCVKIGTEVSGHNFVNHGVPQGTVLGPLIFLLYVNDFSEKTKVTLSLFNLQTILVFYVDMIQEEQLQQKFKIFHWRWTVTWRKINSLWMLIKQNYFIFLPGRN